MIRKQGWSLLTVWLLAATASAQEEGAFNIRGRVIDADAKPVANAAVRLLAAGYGGFDVDEKTTTDADGRFSMTAPKLWVRMDVSQRQELSVVAVQGGRIALVQFNRSSAPPKSDVELVFAKVSPAKITILSPELRPVVGAQVKIAGMKAETILVDLTEAEAKQYHGGARKTSLGYVIGSGTVGLPEDLQLDIGPTDASGQATVSHVAVKQIGGVTVVADEFGEQSVAHHAYQGAIAPADWPLRVVLKKPGRLVGQLSSPLAEAVAKREVTLSTFAHDPKTGVYHNTNAKIVSDRDGKFEVAKMAPGAVRYDVKFDAALPTRPPQVTIPPQLKPGETLQLKIDMKPAVRVTGLVLDSDSKKPIRDVPVRAYLGNGFESTISDAEGKIVFWMPAGDTMFHPEIPDGYLPAISPSDNLDPAKRQNAIAVFKVPEGKTFEAPPIRLVPAATLRGVVLDDQGRPVSGAGVSGVTMALDQRSFQPKTRELTAQTNERGEFTFAAIDPRESMRLRITAKESSKIVTIAKPGSETVRIVLALNERFHITGRVADAEGKPVADAVLEVWHRDWRPAPNVSEAKKLSFKEPIRADAQGNFKTPTLAPDGHYRFTIRAAGAKTTESAWLDATQLEAGKPQKLVVTRLGGLSGVVRDRGGKPIADVQVGMFSQETRTETATNKQGEFSLEAPSGKPFCVVVHHPDFRANGSYYEKAPANLNQTMIRITEPGEKLALRSILGKDEREKNLKRLLESLQQKLAQSKDAQEKMRALQSLTGVAPEFVTEFLDKHPLPQAMYNEMLMTQVAMKRASINPEEAEELIGRLKQGAQQSMAYGMLVDALPEKARAKKLEILAESLVGARAEKSPEFRAITLGQVAKRLFDLGEKDRATALLREGEKIANGLSTSAYAGFARGCFATDLALIDLPAALALMKDLKDRNEFPRHHGNTAHRIAGTNPAAAVKILDLIPPPQQNEFNQRDQYAIRVCYRMSKVDLKRALQLANSIVDVPSRAHALGVIAQGVAKTDPKQVSELLRRAFALLEEDAARPDPPQLTGPQGQGAVATGLVLIAEQVDPTMVRECLWRAVALQRTPTDDPQHVWLYATGNNALAMAAARYDGKLAEFLLPTSKSAWISRESQLAAFLANPQRAVEAAEKAPNAKTKDGRDHLQLISYLSTEEDRIPRLILNTMGMWRVDVEDIDF